MNIALKYKDRVDSTMMLPQVNWREPRNARRLQTNIGGVAKSAALATGNGSVAGSVAKKR
jgi:hypothetical protein